MPLRDHFRPPLDESRSWDELHGAWPTVMVLETIGQTDPSVVPEPPTIYATACRWVREVDSRRFRAWTHALTVGQPLPTLPLWLADNLAVPLDLESTYQETCSILRIP